MLILLTNDDGIYAPGLRAMERALASLGEVVVVAPATEQSGVGHSITFLSPLVVKEIFEGETRRGWAVEGSPADCVKLGIFEFCPRQPDLVVSGMNSGLNAGINVLYSGTVAAAIEGAFFGITSVAVSLEENPHAQHDRAAMMACELIRQLVASSRGVPRLFNLNIPTVACHAEDNGTTRTPDVRIVPMGVMRYGEHYLRRTDPKGRTYYWATNEPPPPATPHETDLSALNAGAITITPLKFDLTQFEAIHEMSRWSISLEHAKRPAD